MRPALPAPLARVSQLAYNVLWSWEPTIRNLFRRMDPALWELAGHNPVSILGRAPQATLERLAADPRYLTLYRRACERYDAYMHRAETVSTDQVASEILALQTSLQASYQTTSMLSQLTLTKYL